MKNDFLQPRALGCIWLAVVSTFSSVPSANATTIGEAVTQAFANSNARQVAIETIEAQNRQVAISQGDRRATIDLFAELAMEQTNDGTVVGPRDENTQVARQAAIALTFPILDGNRTLNQVFRDANVLDAEIIRLSDAAETISLNAVRAYIDVFRRRQIVNISEENITTHVTIATQVGQLVEAGRLSEPDRFQANDKLLAARLAHSGAKASLNDAISNYQLVVGMAPRGSFSIPTVSGIPRSADAIEASAVQNSYLLRIAQKDIDAFEYQEIISTADWKPRLDVFLRGGVETDIDGAEGTETTLSTGLQLNWTFYKGGTRKETIARIRDLKMRAYYQKKQVEDEVRDLARTTWNSYVAAIERRQLLESTETNNEQIVAAFRQEVLAAKRPLLEVLDAERSLFNIKVQRANAQAAVAFQQYRMLATQSKLARHFGLSPFGSNLTADFENRVKANPRGDFDITATPLE